MRTRLGGFEIKKEWKDKNGRLRFTVICNVCGKDFDRAFNTLNKYRIKNCGCVNPHPQLLPLPEYINGFKIIKCYGSNPKGGDRRATVECKICKRVYESSISKLKNNKSCGCVRHMGRPLNRYSKSHPRLSSILSNMKVRCYNKKSNAYKNYGARGITICDEWLNDPNIFCQWALKNNYSDSLSIERIDNDKGYSPNNCKWIPLQEQARNTRCTKMNFAVAKKIRSSKLSATKLAEKYGLKVTMIYDLKNNRCWIPSGDAN